MRAAIEVGHQVTAGCPHELDGYRQLWAGVLLVALEDARGHVKAGNFPGNIFRAGGPPAQVRSLVRRRVTHGALEWFVSERREAGSFLWICGLLDLDPGAVLERLGGSPP